MKSHLQTVEELTDIIARQAAVISKLYSVVEQLNAVISFDEELEELQKAANEAINQARHE